MKKKILLVKSNSMDANKKKDRNECDLLRASESTRNNLGFGDKAVTVYSKTDESFKAFDTFKAFSKDIKKAKSLCEQGLLDKKYLNNVCFVSSETFAKFSDVNHEIVEVTTIKDFTKMLIGTDPELLIMHKGKIVHAGEIEGFSKHTQFGCDGAMAELRPDPSYTPEGLVQNMQEILNDPANNHGVRDYDWTAACYFENAARDFPVGTHLHFDNPLAIKKLDAGSKNRLFAVTNKIIDELLTLPMIRLDGPSGHSRRAHCKMSQMGNFGNAYGIGYGFFGEWRTCEGRLEHRSLSGLVISNKDICRDVFGTAQAIVSAVYDMVIKEGLDSEFILPEVYDAKAIYGKKFKNWGKIPLADSMGCVKSSEFMHTCMDASCRVEVSPQYIKNWLKVMKKLPTYAKYETYIESLGDLLVCNAKTLDKVDKNIKKNWSK